MLKWSHSRVFRRKQTQERRWWSDCNCAVTAVQYWGRLETCRSQEESRKNSSLESSVGSPCWHLLGSQPSGLWENTSWLWATQYVCLYVMTVLGTSPRSPALDNSWAYHLPLLGEGQPHSREHRVPSPANYTHFFSVPLPAKSSFSLPRLGARWWYYGCNCC